MARVINCATNIETIPRRYEKGAIKGDTDPGSPKPYTHSMRRYVLAVVDVLLSGSWLGGSMGLRSCARYLVAWHIFSRHQNAGVGAWNRDSNNIHVKRTSQPVATETRSSQSHARPRVVQNRKRRERIPVLLVEVRSSSPTRGSGKTGYFP